MKRLVTLLCLAALLLPVASCNKNNEQKVKTPVTPPAYSQYAKKYAVPDNAERIVGLEFTEAGRYLITRKLEVKATPDEEYEYLSGSYTVNGNTYDLQGYGTVVIDGNQITITPNGKSPVVVTVTPVNPMESTDFIVSICSTWKVDKVDMNISGGDIKQGAAGVTVNGCNISQIVNQLNNNYGINADAEVVKGMEVKCISITKAQTLIIEFTDSQFQPFVADFQLNGSTFEYEIQGQELGNDIFNSQAKGKVEPKSDGSLWLEISANVDSENKEYKCTVTLILSRYKD